MLVVVFFFSTYLYLYLRVCLCACLGELGGAGVGGGAPRTCDGACVHGWLVWGGGGGELEDGGTALQPDILGTVGWRC